MSHYDALTVNVREPDPTPIHSGRALSQNRYLLTSISYHLSVEWTYVTFHWFKSRFWFKRRSKSVSKSIDSILSWRLTNSRFWNSSQQLQHSSSVCSVCHHGGARFSNCNIVTTRQQVLCGLSISHQTHASEAWAGEAAHTGSYWCWFMWRLNRPRAPQDSSTFRVCGRYFENHESLTW